MQPDQRAADDREGNAVNLAGQAPTDKPTSRWAADQLIGLLWP